MSCPGNGQRSPLVHAAAARAARRSARASLARRLRGSAPAVAALLVAALLLHGATAPAAATAPVRSHDGGIARVHDADPAFAFPGQRLPEIVRPERAPVLAGFRRVATPRPALRTRFLPQRLRTSAAPPRARSDVHRVRIRSADDPPPTLALS